MRAGPRRRPLRLSREVRRGGGFRELRLQEDGVCGRPHVSGRHGRAPAADRALVPGARRIARRARDSHERPARPVLPEHRPCVDGLRRAVRSALLHLPPGRGAVHPGEPLRLHGRRTALRGGRPPLHQRADPRRPLREPREWGGPLGRGQGDPAAEEEPPLVQPRRTVLRSPRIGRGRAGVLQGAHAGVPLRGAGRGVEGLHD